MASSSLSEFWGRRWNTAFHELATQFTFRPAKLMVGRTAATRTNSRRRLGYHALNVVFAYLPIVYALAASQPRWLK